MKNKLGGETPHNPLRLSYGLQGTCLNERKVDKIIPQAVQVTRMQLPTIPTSTITTYKTQGLTMSKIVVDLQAPVETLQLFSIYESLGRLKTVEDIVILRVFDKQFVQVRPYYAQDIELKCLDELNRKAQRECASFAF